MVVVQFVVHIIIYIHIHSGILFQVEFVTVVKRCEQNATIIV